MTPMQTAWLLIIAEVVVALGIAAAAVRWATRRARQGTDCRHRERPAGPTTPVRCEAACDKAEAPEQADAAHR